MNTRKTIILAGGNGFLGQVLSRHFASLGHPIVILTRSPAKPEEGIRQVAWDGRTPGSWVRHLEGALAVVNLAGRSVNCRYNKRNRELIMASRRDSTRVIGEAVRRCADPPGVWLNSSTATLYKHTFGPAWDESGVIAAHPDAKDAFSVEVAVAWEREFEEADAPSTRKILLRTAMVLGRGSNSVFPVLRRLTRLGLGGRMGTGRQFVSWIHQNDFARAIEWLIKRKEAAGVFNVAAPNPLPNAVMMRTLREVCGRTFGLPAAAWMLEVGAYVLRTETELLIKSRRVVPGRLRGFHFQFPRIRDAFNDLQDAFCNSRPGSFLSTGEGQACYSLGGAGREGDEAR